MQSFPGGNQPVKCKDPCKNRKCRADETCVDHNCFRCKATCRKNRAPSGRLPVLTYHSRTQHLSAVTVPFQFSAW